MNLKYYMDESGYTGYDLLNTDQPFQGAATFKIDEKTAEDLIKQYFPKNKSLELKHKALSRRPSNWDSLLKIQKELLTNYNGISYVCDKKFLLTLMFLDFCVEPFYYDQNIDFYEDGQNYSAASLIYKTAPTFWGEENFNELLWLFQRAERTKSDIAINALVEKTKVLGRIEFEEFLGPLSMGYPSCIESIKNPKVNTDVSFIVLLSLISYVEKHENDDYEIVHDTSNNLKKYNEILKKLVHYENIAEFKHTEITSIKFPLRLSSVSQCDSKNSFGVQLADILIGGIIEFSMGIAGKVQKTDYNQSILSLYGDENIIHLLPNLDFEEQKEFHKNNQSQDFINFFGKNFS